MSTVVRPKSPVTGYRVLRELSATRSRVCLAHDERSGRRVALKLFSVRRGKDVAERCLKLYRALAAIDHDNVMRVYAADWLGDEDRLQAESTADILAFAAAEYVGVGELEEVIFDGMSPARAVSLLCGIASGLGAVHAAGLIHGDLAPGHVLLRENGAPVLIGFTAPGDEAAPARRAAPTNRRYHSPQRRAGAVPCVADDFYALGVMFYDMLTGAEADEAGGGTWPPPLPPGLARCEPLVQAMTAAGAGGTQMTAQDVARLAARLREGAVDPAPAGYVPAPGGSPDASPARAASDETPSQTVPVAATAELEALARASGSHVDFDVGGVDAASPETSTEQALDIDFDRYEYEDALEAASLASKESVDLDLGELFEQPGAGSDERTVFELFEFVEEEPDTKPAGVSTPAASPPTEDEEPASVTPVAPVSVSETLVDAWLPDEAAYEAEQSDAHPDEAVYEAEQSDVHADEVVYEAEQSDAHLDEPDGAPAHASRYDEVPPPAAASAPLSSEAAVPARSPARSRSLVWLSRVAMGGLVALLLGFGWAAYESLSEGADAVSAVGRLGVGSERETGAGSGTSSVNRPSLSPARAFSGQPLDASSAPPGPAADPDAERSETPATGASREAEPELGAQDSPSTPEAAPAPADRADVAVPPGEQQSAPASERMDTPAEPRPTQPPAPEGWVALPAESAGEIVAEPAPGEALGSAVEGTADGPAGPAIAPVTESRDEVAADADAPAADVSAGPTEAGSREADPGTAPSAEDPSDPELASAPETAAVPVSTASRPSREVLRLLALGRESLGSDRLTTPPQESAYHYYREVLRLQPDSGEAAALRADIVARYVQLAESEWQSGSFKNARALATRGLNVDSTNEALAQLLVRDVPVETSPPASVPRRVEAPAPSRRARTEEGGAKERIERFLDLFQPVGPGREPPPRSDR